MASWLRQLGGFPLSTIVYQKFKVKGNKEKHVGTTVLRGPFDHFYLRLRWWILLLGRDAGTSHPHHVLHIETCKGRVHGHRCMLHVYRRFMSKLGGIIGIDTAKVVMNMMGRWAAS